MNKDLNIKVFSDGFKGVIVVNGIVQRIKLSTLEKEGIYISRCENNEKDFLNKLNIILEDFAKEEPYKLINLKSEVTNDLKAYELIDKTYKQYNLDNIIYPKDFPRHKK